MAGFIENNITNVENILTTTDRTAYLYSKIQPIFKDVVVAIIILLIGLIIGKLLGRVIQKILTSFELDKLVRKVTGLKISMEEFLGKITSYSVFIIAVIIALDVLNLTSIIVYIISIILIAIIVFSIFVSIKDFFPKAHRRTAQERELFQPAQDSLPAHTERKKSRRTNMPGSNIPPRLEARVPPRGGGCRALYAAHPAARVL